MSAETTDTQAGERFRELTIEEGWAMLDRLARQYHNMSGREFVEAWESGKFDDDPDRPEVIRLAMLIAFTR